MRPTKFRSNQTGQAGRGRLHALLLLLFLVAAAPLPVGAASAPFYPKNLASPLLGTRIRVDATPGFHLANGYPLPVTPGGTADVGVLLTDDFDGLEFAPGTHSLTLTLASPQIVDRVSFLNRTAEGTFTAVISGSDPQLLGPAPTRSETKLAGPDMINSAVFQPQAAQFIRLEFKITKRGRLGRISVYGRASELDYSVNQRPPPAASASPVLMPVSSIEIDVAAPSAGARVTRVSSQKADADPFRLITDSLDSIFFFYPSDRAPFFDIDFDLPRRANRAAVLLSGPSSRIDLIRIPAWVAPAPPATVEGVVTRCSGTVELMGLSELDNRQVKPGGLVRGGEIVRTGFDSQVEFEVGGKSLVRIGPRSSAFVRATPSGVELNVLRGAALWQVFAAGGGMLVTPTTMAEVPEGTVGAEVRLDGGSRFYLLETDFPTGVQVRSRAFDERYTLHPGEDLSLAPGLDSGFVIEPFAVKTYWSQAPVGAVLGGLRNEVDKKFGIAGPVQAEEILGSATTPDGLSQVSIAFKEQSLDGVRLRITPVSPNSPAPIIVVKAEVFGTYRSDELEVVRKGSAVPPLEPVAAPAAPTPTPTPPAAAPAAVAPQAAAPAQPVPVPAPLPRPSLPPSTMPLPSSAASTFAPNPILAPVVDTAPATAFVAPPVQVKKAGAVPSPAATPVPMAAPPAAPAPVPVPPPQKEEPAPLPDNGSDRATQQNIFDRQNSKRIPLDSSIGTAVPAHPLIPS